LKELSCAFTGHRPERFSFSYYEGAGECLRIKELLLEQIKAFMVGGVFKFYSGMALGVDQWAAAAVLDMKKQHPNVRLVAVRPCETQADRWNDEQRERYYNILAECDDEIVISKHFTRSCMFERNRRMVDLAEHLLAVYDGDEHGGTAYTVRYARQKRRQITIIHPDTLTVTSPVDVEALQRRSQLKIVRGKEE